jgi:hypothetical protein
MNLHHSVIRNASLIFGAALLVFLVSSEPASAYWYWQCGGDPTTWRSDPTFRINRNNIAAGSLDDADMTEAMTRWNLTPGAWFDFVIGTAASGTTSTSDGQNRIEYHFPAHVAVGHAHVRYDTCITWWPGPNQDIEEADVHFVADWLPGAGLTWNRGAPDPRVGTGNPLRLAAIHELGHALGLSPTNATHENSLLDNMNAAIPAGGATGGGSTVRANTLPDSARGFRFLYPGSATAVDQFTTNFRLTAGSTSATLVPSLPRCARPGDTIPIFFTVGNRGNLNSPNTSCGVYMSTNTTISTADTQLLDCSWAPGAHALAESFSFSVRIPSSTPTGTIRFFGMLLDDGGAVSESIESNNAVAAPGSPSTLDGVRIQASCP